MEHAGTAVRLYTQVNRCCCGRVRLATEEGTPPAVGLDVVCFVLGGAAGVFPGTVDDVQPLLGCQSNDLHVPDHGLGVVDGREVVINL